MDKIVPRTRGARFSQQIDCLIYLAQKKMTPTQRIIINGYERVMWIEPAGFLELGDCRLRLTEASALRRAGDGRSLDWIERNLRL